MATTQSKYGGRFDEEFKREVAALANRQRLHGALGFQPPVDFEHSLNETSFNPALRPVR